MNQQLNTHDRLAPYYDFLTSLVFWGQLKKAKKVHLNEIIPSMKILILGGGTGDELESLLHRNSGFQITYVEASEIMLARAKRRISRLTPVNVCFHHSSEIPDDHYDIVITPFFLDLFSNPQMKEVGQQIYNRLKNNGLWLFTDFQISPGRQWWQAPFIRVMYIFFQMTTGLRTQKLPDFQQLFSRLNLQKLKERSFYGGMIISVIFKKIKKLDIDE